MASANDIRAENECLERKIQTQVRANQLLEKEMQELKSECKHFERKKIIMLKHELNQVDEEIRYFRSRCRSLRDIIERTNANQVIKKESEQLRVSRTYSSAFSQTMQQMKDIAVPLQQHSSKVVHGLTRAASCVNLPTTKLSSPGVNRTKSSRTILSIFKDTTDLTENLFYSAWRGGLSQEPRTPQCGPSKRVVL